MIAGILILAALILLVLLGAGYREEAKSWREWLLRAIAGSPDRTRTSRAGRESVCADMGVAGMVLKRLADAESRAGAPPGPPRRPLRVAERPDDTGPTGPTPTVRAPTLPAL